MAATLAELLSGEPSSYISGPGGSTEGAKYRRRIAEMLIKQGADTSPVQAWTQGAARLANALAGGYEFYKADQEDKASEAETAKALGNLPGLTPAAPSAVPTSAPAASPPDTTQPRGYRNNNPLNIEAGGFTQGQPGFAGSDGRFAKFASMDEGLGAANKLLDTYQNKHGLNTVGGIINRWAPPGENDSRGYAASVSGRIGVSPDQPLTPEQRPALVQAMAQFENGRPLPQPQQPAQAAPQQAPQAAPARGAPSIPPQMGSYIQSLVASNNPKVRAYGMQLYQQYAKPTEQYTQGVDENGVPFQRNTVTGKIEADPRKDSAINEAEYAQRNWQKLGFPDPASKDQNSVKFWQDFNAKRLGGPSTNVTVDQRGENEFSKEAGKLTAKRYADLADDVPTAKQMISDVKTLTTLGQQIGTGKEAQFKAAIGPYAEALGIKVDKLSEIQAFEAVVNRVAPNLRVKGSGSQSDFELRNFLKALPTLSNTPEGNALASRVMEGLYQNKLKAGEIASAVLNGEMSRKDGDKAIRELADPMEEYRQLVKDNPGASIRTNDEGGYTVKKYNPATGKIE